MFIVAVDQRLMAPLLPAIAEDFDATISEVGVAVTAYLLPYGFFQLVYGPLADRVGRVRVISLALIGFGVASLLCAASPSLSGFTLFRFLTGVTAAAVIPLTFTYIGDNVPYSRRAAAIGITAVSISTGFIVANVFGGLLASLISWRAIFLIDGLATFIVAGILIRYARSRMRSGVVASSTFEKFKLVLANRRNLIFFGIVIVEGVVTTGGYSYFGLLLRDRAGYSFFVIGIILSLFGFSSIVAGRYLGRIASMLGEPRMVLVGGFLVAAGYLLSAAPATIPLFLIAMLVAGFGNTVMHTTFQIRATGLTPDARATGVTFFAFSLFMGSSFGALGIAILIDQYGFSPVMVGLGFATILLAVVAPIITFSKPTADNS